MDLTHKCPQCDKTFKQVKRLQRHIKSHEQSYKCRFCDARFGRRDEAPSHELRVHGQNVSRHVCYIPGCHRALLGLKSEDALIQHLQQSHNGATMAKNNEAMQEQGHDPDDDDEPAVEHDPEGTLSERDPSDHEDDEDDQRQELTDSDEEMTTEGDEVDHTHCAAEIKALRDQLQKEREMHRIEIEEIHKAHKAKLEQVAFNIASYAKYQVQKE